MSVCVRVRGLDYTLPSFRLLLCVCLLLLLDFTSGVENSNNQRNNGKKVLLFPVGHGYSSHIMDFQGIAKVLTARGYNVSVLINDEDRHYMEEVGSVRVHSYPCCDRDSPDGTRLRLTDDRFRELILTQTNRSAVEFIHMLSEQQIRLCEQLLKSKAVLREVTNEQYDVLIVDFADSCSRVVVQYFSEIPAMVYNGVGFTIDAAFFPNLATMVPTFTTNFLDDMSFWERTENMLRLLLIKLLCDPYYFSAFDDLKHSYGMSKSLPTVRKAFAGKLTLAHASWALDFPRPLLPTVVSVGGMHMDEAKPLSPDVAAFIRKAGQRGLVLVSFGSLVDKLETQKAEVVAAGLAQLDQGVIWRYTGVPPTTIGGNTLLLDWIPQNDLLAHPLTKVFVTHCGIHGTYEALRYAVPIIAVPLFADQFENANKLIRRAKMGVRLDHTNLTAGLLVDAIREVMANATYKNNAIAMSKLLYDRPVSARDTFLYYVDYVIRHGGSGPLVSTPVVNLDTFELYGLDIALFLLSVVVTAIALMLLLLAVTVRLCGWLYRRYRKRKVE